MTATKPGKFITLEGTEGVGKSSNLTFINGYLADKGIELVQTREPGGTALAESIRELVLRPRTEKMSDLTELLLIFAARAQHIDQVIAPNLAAGRWVLCDRFTDATYAYQGYGRGLPLEVIAQLETLVQKELRPDLTIVLDLDVKIGLQRAKQRGNLDRIETEQQQFFENVRRGYHDRAKARPDHYAMIDASGSLPEVQSQLIPVLDSILVKAGANNGAR